MKKNLAQRHLEGKVLKLTVGLNGTKPRVWRKLIIPFETTFLELHNIIQVAMGWENYHLFSFEAPRMKRILEPSNDFEFDDDEEDATKAIVGKYVMDGYDKFNYIYDFGCHWSHTVTVGEIMDKKPKMKYPVCISGKNNCPPEDGEDRDEFPVNDFDIDITEVNKILAECHIPN